MDIIKANIYLMSFENVGTLSKEVSTFFLTTQDTKKQSFA